MLKKSVFLFVGVLLLTLPLRAQFLDINSNYDRYMMGVHLGQAGSNTEYADFGFGFSFSVWGVYLDFTIAPPEYSDDNHLVDQLVPDDEAFSINIGYQIPITSWLRICPIVGYSQTNWGYTDLGTLNQHIEDDGDISIHHDYDPEERFHEFNYGGGLFIQPFEFLEIYGVYTVRAIYGGLSFNLGSIRNW